MKHHITHRKIKQIQHHLKQEGIIAYATESCFGLGVLPNHPKAIRRLIRLKKRDARKGLIVIGSHLAQFHSLIKPLSTSDSAYLNQEWPAAKTYLVPAKSGIFPLLRGIQHKKLAIRIPDHSGARKLCQQLKSALISTSANISRQNNCRSFRETKRQFGNKAMVIPGEIGHYKKSSQILDLATLHKIR